MSHTYRNGEHVWTVQGRNGKSIDLDALRDSFGDSGFSVEPGSVSSEAIVKNVEHMGFPEDTAIALQAMDARVIASPLKPASAEEGASIDHTPV